MDSHRLNRRCLRSSLCRHAAIGLPTLVGIALWPLVAHASFLPPDLVDTAADVLAVVVLILVPVAGIYLFWKVHVLPEIIAEKRHHPQKEAIKTLCILSLVFGGLLWPFAWLWAYTKPVLYRAAYGTDKHEDFYKELAELKAAEESDSEEVKVLKTEIAELEARVAKLSKKEGRTG